MVMFLNADIGLNVFPIPNAFGFNIPDSIVYNEILNSTMDYTIRHVKIYSELYSFLNASGSEITLQTVESHMLHKFTFITDLKI